MKIDQVLNLRKPNFENFKKTIITKQPGPVRFGDFFADLEVVGGLLGDIWSLRNSCDLNLFHNCRRWWILRINMTNYSYYILVEKCIL